MKIIISPAKKMRVDTNTLEVRHMPVFIEKADKLRAYLREIPFDELKDLLGCNGRLAALNYARYQDMDLYNKAFTPAILAYDGVQYQYMAPQIFEDRYFTYVDKHLRILSGLYGMLRPLDGVVPYRLEMRARLKTDFCRSLYNFWGDSIYRELVRDDNVILNLASQEYSRTIEKFLRPEVQYVSCTFGELENGGVREKGVYVKMARGEMVRFMAENNITDIEDIKAFNRLGFRYCDAVSDKERFVFLREKTGGPGDGKGKAADDIAE